MRNYEELVKRLRVHNGWALNDTLDEAANAIEELSKPRWIKFTARELDEEEQQEHPEWCYILDCNLPDDGQEILVSNGKWVWMDTFCNDVDECYLDNDSGDLVGLWWMPLPEPPKEAIT